MSGWRGTVILLAIVGLLFAVMRWSGGKELPPTDVAEPALDGRALLEARHITITTGEMQPIEIEQRGGFSFHVVEPVEDLASRARLESMSDAWSSARLHRFYVADELDDDLLGQIGLATPRATLQVDFEDGHSVAVDLGAEGPLGEDLYARKNGDVYVCSKALYTTLLGTPDDFRERLLFRTPPQGVERLMVESRNGDETSRLTVIRAGQGTYRLQEPVDSRASGPAVGRFLAQLLGTQIDGYVAGVLMPQEPPSYTISVNAGSEFEERVDLWRRPDGGMIGLHHQRGPRGLPFAMAGTTFGQVLEQPEAALRSRIMISISPNELQQIVIDRGVAGEAPVVLRRAGNQEFELAQPVRSATNPTAVAAVIDGLAQFAVRDFVADCGGPEELAPYGLDKGYIRLEVTGGSNPRPTEIHLGEVRDGLCYARRADESWVVTLPAAAVEPFRQAWPGFVSRHFGPALSVDDIRRIQLRRGDQVTGFRKGTGGNWRDTYRWEIAEFVFDVVEELADLRSETVIAASALPAEDVVEVELQAENEMPLFKFAAMRHDGRIAVWRPDRNVVHLLGRRASGLLEQLLP